MSELQNQPFCIYECMNVYHAKILVG